MKKKSQGHVTQLLRPETGGRNVVIELLCDTSTPGESTDGVGVGLKTKKREKTKRTKKKYE